ncbi:MAG: hypothetical protein HY291_21920 [Planctomycetes bacterium]|nr:hypothetical protein [Planctomycetota bacterium]
MRTLNVLQMPPRRRDEAFGRIRQIVTEVAAVDRALEGVGEGLAVDEALEEIVELLAEELARPRTRRRLAVPT